MPRRQYKSSTPTPIRKQAKRGCKKSPATVETPPPKMSAREPDEIDLAIMRREECMKERAKMPSLDEIKKFRQNFKKVCEQTKKQMQELDYKQKKPVGRTRSASKKPVIRQEVSTDGKWINKGMDDAIDRFDADELEYLKNSASKVKAVNELKLEHIKYLVIDVFLDELKGIKQGKIESSFHKRYHELSGKSKSDMGSDVRTSLFTNQQRDYINGLLQGAFDTTSKDDSGDIKHSDIDYVGLVMLAEVIIRIVKYVHKFQSNLQAYEFMVSKSREALGLEDSD